MHQVTFLSKEFDENGIYLSGGEQQKIALARSLLQQADSIMDRIVYNAYEIPTSETNLRKIYDTKRLKKLVDAIEK